MTPEERAWVAGFLEGEGSFILIKRPGHRSSARVSAQSTDFDVICRVRDLTGLGAVVKVKDRAGRKPCWDRKVCGHDEARKLMAELRPLMGQRRQARIDEIFSASTPLSIPHCESGHDVFDPENAMTFGQQIRCRACNDARMSAMRTAKAAA